MNSFEEALDFLYTKLPMYQRVGKIAYKKDLTNTIALLEGIGNPERKFRSIHIAGTNGKGTSAHAIAAILQLAGYKTGLYTSPHLKRFTERIKVNGTEIGEEAVLKFTTKNIGLIDKIAPSFFEVTVAMAFDHFALEEVDIAVIETGLGGRLDSTNVILPEVCLITNIGFDHMDLLGDTIPKIAFEKAGIIKSGVPVVIGDMVPEAIEVMESMANERESKIVLTQPQDVLQADISRTPPYFKRNIPGVLGVINVLKEKGWVIPESAILNGLKSFIEITDMKGRYQVIQESPLTIADVSHNPDGLKILFEHIKMLQFDQLRIVFGTVKDKDLKPIFEILPKNAKYYLTQSHVPRKLPVEELELAASAYGIVGETFDHVDDAKKAAQKDAAKNDLIIITGSTFVVAELSEL